MTLEIGQVAPDFILHDQYGQQITLSQFKHHAEVVLFFYPKSFTPGCTREVCQFRDQYDVFQSSGAVVIGISSDDSQTQHQFATSHQVPFILLSDPEGCVRKAYDVKPTLGAILGNRLPGRETFVIDRAGIIQYRFRSQLNPDAHIEKALTTLKRIQGEHRN